MYAEIFCPDHDIVRNLRITVAGCSEIEQSSVTTLLVNWNPACEERLWVVGPRHGLTELFDGPRW